MKTDVLPPSGMLVLLRALRERAEQDIRDLDERIEDELRRMASGPYHDADGKVVLPQLTRAEQMAAECESTTVGCRE